MNMKDREHQHPMLDLYGYSLLGIDGSVCGFFLLHISTLASYVVLWR